MRRRYVLLFKTPVTKDWAFWAWAILTLIASGGGENLVAGGIVAYIMSFMWLIPRRLLFRSTYSQNAVNVDKIFEPDGAGEQPQIRSQRIYGFQQSENQKVDTDKYILRGGGYQEVVGESHKKKSFQAIAKGKKQGEVFVPLNLARDVGNRYDKHAISVSYKGYALGFIPKEDAPRWEKLMIYLEQKNLSVYANGRIWWDFNQDSEYDPFASVELYVAEPEFAFVHSGGNNSNKIDISGERSYQLADESNYLETYKRILEKAIYPGKIAIQVELRLSPDHIQTNRKTIEVLFEDNVIGVLSGVTGNKYLNVIRSLSGTDAKLVASCDIVGNSIAAEARIYLTMPENFSGEIVKAIQSFTQNKT